MTKTMIDERISKAEDKIKQLIAKKGHIDNLICGEQLRLSKLMRKKARQQKDAAIGDKLVESGVITEQQNQEIQGLPVPEKKANPPIYNPEV